MLSLTVFGMLYYCCYWIYLSKPRQSSHSPKIYCDTFHAGFFVGALIIAGFALSITIVESGTERGLLTWLGLLALAGFCSFLISEIWPGRYGYSATIAVPLTAVFVMASTL